MDILDKKILTGAEEEEMWKKVKPRKETPVLNQEETNTLLNALNPVVGKAINMGPVRRKLHSLRVSFGRFVYDQKAKHLYNAALKRGKTQQEVLTVEETQSLLNAMKHEMPAPLQNTNTNADSGREM